MNILGINFGHDASLALFSNGELVQFEELERATRLKHQYGVTADQILVFLHKVHLKIADISLVSVCGTQCWAWPHDSNIRINPGCLSDQLKSVVGDKIIFGPKQCAIGDGTGGSYYLNHLKLQNIGNRTPSLVTTELRYSYIRGFDFSGDALAEEFQKLIGMDDGQLKQMQSEFLIPGVIQIKDVKLPMLSVDHHYCHANYAYFYSPEIQSIVSTHDGGLTEDPFNSGGIYITNDMGVTPIIDHRLFLGYLYDQISQYAQVSESGKLMGLSSYAVPDALLLRMVDDLILNASRPFNLAEINQCVTKIINSSNRTLIRKRAKSKFKFDDKISDSGIQAAANIQTIVESVFIHTVGATASLLADIDSSYSILNLTGGFTLNCPTNSLLKQKFQNLNINPLPGCGDTGISIGACVAVHNILNVPMKREGGQEVTAAFPPLKFDVRFCDNDFLDCQLERLEYAGSIPHFIADTIIDGKLLCIFRGRSEVGPRALGRRSIIAHAIHEDIRDKINISKGRETWRPLAPICRVDDYNEYFDGDAYDSRYMLFTNRAKNPALKAVTHIDGSARAQAITNQDPWLYEALGEIKARGHIPVIINTSFNCAGEPIVETIQNAFRSFSKMNFDYLITEYGIFRRNRS